VISSGAVDLVGGLDDDLVAGVEVRHVPQRLAVGDPVAGEHEVPRLARTGGPREVPEAAREHVVRRPLQQRHLVVVPELRDQHDRRRGAVLGLHLLGALAPGLVELFHGLGLAAVRDVRRTPQLPPDGAEDDQPASTSRTPRIRSARDLDMRSFSRTRRVRRRGRPW
jgi:hypothetical protein